MLRTLTTKIIAATVLAIVLTAAGISTVSWRRIAAQSYQEQTVAAGNILRLVTLNIQSQYNRLVDFEMEFIARRRELLRQKNATILAYFLALEQAAQRGEISEEDAKRRCLSWLEALPANDWSGVVADRSLASLAQSPRIAPGQDLSGLQSLRGESAFAKARDSLSDASSTYSVILWPDAPAAAPRKHLACFTAFPPWGWIVASIEPIDDLEKLAASKRESILEELGRTLPELTVPGSGYLFLFNGVGEMLIHPTIPRGSLEGTGRLDEGKATYELFKEAALKPGVPVRYNWTPAGESSDAPEKLAFVEYFKPLDWYVCYALGKKDLETPADKLVGELLAVILATSLAGLLLALVFIKRYTRPLVELTDIVTGMPKREFLVDDQGGAALARLSAKRNDEPGRLASAFLGLQDKLRRHLGELSRLNAERLEHIEALNDLNLALEARVAERTAALRQTNERLEAEARQREAAAVSLRRSEEQFRALAESMPGVIYLSKNDARFTKLYLNDAVLTLTGYSKEEFLKDRVSLVDLVHPDDRPLVVETATRAGRDGTSFRLEYRIQRRDGQWRWMEEYGTGALAMEETGAAIEGVIYDVTERVKARELLRAAKNQAEAANIAKSEFLATMSHEIRTPIHIILGVAEVLRDGVLRPDQRQQIEMLLTAGVGLNALINDILDFSRIEAGDVVLEALPFDARALFEETSRSLAIEAHKKDLEFILRIDPGLPRRLVGDQGRIRQLFVNLVGNAVKFTESGEIEVRVQGRSAGRDAWRLHVGVRDTGVGVAPDKLEVIFDRFIQADASTTRKFGGSGLGLSICRKLIDLMAGAIDVQSVPGRGSTFSFELDLGVADPAPGFDPHALIGLRILAVEPSEAGGTMLVEAIEAMGARADHVADAQSALAAWSKAIQEEAPYHVVLMDARLADDDFGLAQTLKETPGAAARLFLLSSTNALTKTMRRAASLELAGVLVKPASPGDLIRRFSPGSWPPEPLAIPDSRKEAPEPGPAAPLKLLVVEDSAPVRALMTLFLRDTPHAFDLAKDGQEALGLFAEHDYDVVLLDMLMPGMDGFEIAGKLRENERLSGRRPARLVALTACAEADAPERCQRSGCDAYLAKPVTRQALLRLLENRA